MLEGYKSAEKYRFISGLNLNPDGFVTETFKFGFSLMKQVIGHIYGSVVLIRAFSYDSPLFPTYEFFHTVYPDTSNAGRFY